MEATSWRFGPLGASVCQVPGGGGGGGGAAAGGSARNPSKASVVVKLPVTRVRIPTEPAVCRPAAELVVVTCHDDGSAVPVSHALARIVVGLAPVACTRSTKVSPAEKLRPVSTSANRFAFALVCPRMKTLPPEVT